MVDKQVNVFYRSFVVHDLFAFLSTLVFTLFLGEKLDFSKTSSYSATVRHYSANTEQLANSLLVRTEVVKRSC